jgi:sugar-specific transcriptional regulator TrmB
LHDEEVRSVASTLVAAKEVVEEEEFNLGLGDHTIELVKQEILEELKKLDVTQNEAKILLHLISKGPSLASDISKSIGMPRTETYHYISSLLGKGVVLSTFSKPRKYYSLPFDEVVDHLVQTKYNTLRSILQNKKDYQRKLDRIAITSSSTTMTSQAAEEDDKSYQIISGEDAINAKIQRMLDSVTGKVCAKLSDKTVEIFYNAETIDHFTSSAKRGVKVEISTLSRSITHYLKTIGKENECHLSVLSDEIQSVIPADFIIFDGKEVMIMFEEVDGKDQKKMCAFYANSLGIVSTFGCIFEKI